MFGSTKKLQQALSIFSFPNTQKAVEDTSVSANKPNQNL